MKYKQFFQPVDKSFSSPKAIGKLLQLLAWVLLVCLFCGLCFYWVSSFNNEVSKHRRVMNDEVFNVQELLFQREALLLHFSRSVYLKAPDVLPPAEALKVPLGQDQRKKLLLGNFNSPWSLSLSGRDLRELDELQMGLVYVSNNAEHTISRIHDRSFDHYVLPSTVLNALTATAAASNQAFIWLNDPNDPFSRIYIFRRISNEKDGGWLGLKMVSKELATGLIAQDSDGYLLLNKARRQVLGSEPNKDLSPYFSTVWSKDGFGLTGSGLNLGYLSLTKSIGGSKWVLIYYVPFETLLASLWWETVLALVVFGLMAVGIQRLVLRINRRLVNPALHRLEALIESEEFSRTVIDTAPVALCVLRRIDGQVVLENRLCVQWLGAQAQAQRISWSQDWIRRAFDDNSAVCEELETASGHHLYLSSVGKQFKQRIRELTRRSGGRSLRQVVENLRPYLLGWKTYFGLSQTPKVWRGLEEWMRHRLRAIQLKQWRRGPTIYRELRALGASSQSARKVAANSYSWWRNSRFELNRVLDMAWCDRLGLVRLS